MEGALTVNYVRLIARLLLGLLFTLAGVLSFVFTTPPPMPGIEGQINALLAVSHWSQFVGFAQLVAGVLLLANRYVPVAVIILAAFLYNSLAFHILTSPTMLPIPVVVLLLWLVVAMQYRDVFAPIFRAKTS